MSFLEKKLTKLGFKTKIITFKDKTHKPVKNLYARLGNKGPNFCYAVHLDVVPPVNINDWTVNPFKPKVKNGHLIGRGANDMKSSIAAFVSAVSIFLSKNKKFDGSINYKTENISKKLKDLCPDGINVYFDNVAGSTLDAVLANMANFGVIAVCGLLENYASKERLPGPYNYDLILMKRLRFEGFFSPDFYHREAEINPILKKWNTEGLLDLPIETTDGLENLVSAYSKLFNGANVGKVVVKV